MMKITEIRLFDSTTMFSVIVRKEEILIFNGNEWLLTLRGNTVILPETRLRRFRDLKNVAVELFKLAQELRSLNVGIKQIVKTLISIGYPVKIVEEKVLDVLKKYGIEVNEEIQNKISRFVTLEAFVIRSAFRFEIAELAEKKKLIGKAMWLSKTEQFKKIVEKAREILQLASSS